MATLILKLYAQRVSFWDYIYLAIIVTVGSTLTIKLGFGVNIELIEEYSNMAEGESVALKDESLGLEDPAFSVVGLAPTSRHFPLHN